MLNSICTNNHHYNTIWTVKDPENQEQQPVDEIFTSFNIAWFLNDEVPVVGADLTWSERSLNTNAKKGKS